jgi:hypothetical protein
MGMNEQDKRMGKNEGGGGWRYCGARHLLAVISVDEGIGRLYAAYLPTNLPMAVITAVAPARKPIPGAYLPTVGDYYRYLPLAGKDLSVAIRIHLPKVA